MDISLSAEAIEALSKPLVPLAQAILHGQPRNEDADSYVSLAQECVLGGEKTTDCWHVSLPGHYYRRGLWLWGRAWFPKGSSRGCCWVSGRHKHAVGNIISPSNASASKRAEGGPKHGCGAGA